MLFTFSRGAILPHVDYRAQVMLEITYIGEVPWAGFDTDVYHSAKFWFLKSCREEQAFTSEGSVCYRWFARETVKFNINLFRVLSVEL